MNRTLCTLALVAAAALAGCDQQNDNAAANEAATNTPEPIVLPPAIASSHAYRCKDNSLAYIDLMNDNRTATVRAERNGAATILTAPEAGQPYAAEGYELTATIGNRAITLTRPGKGRQACRA